MAISELRESAVVHATVIARLWNRDVTDPLYIASVRLFEEVVLPRRQLLLATNHVEVQVLALLSDLLRQTGLQIERFISEPLFDDVRQTFANMLRDDELRLVDGRTLERAAFQTATFNLLPFWDALDAVLAVTRGAPLVVADAVVFERLQAVAFERPELRPILVTDYWASRS